MQIDEAREFIKFLHGAVPWNGTWFGEYAPGEKGAYWWRKHLDEAIAALIAAPAAPQQAEPVGYFVNDESDDQWHQVDYEQRNGADTYPLYLHPPADEVQQAEPVAWMAFGGALVHAVTRNAMDPIEAERFDVPLYLHPPAAPQQAEPCDVCNALTVPRNATHYDADDLKAAQVRGKIIAAKLQQQAEPVAQIGWSDEFGNLFPMGAWKPAQRTHHDSHKTAWRAVYLHPPAAELARLRAENERLRGDNVHLRGHFERAWPDTQRYRWLRATNMEQQNILAHYAYTEMDAAIDAAMAQGDKA